MSKVLTGDKLINSIRKRTFVPDDTSTFTDTDILEIANEELDVLLLEKLLALHEEHLTAHVDIPRSADGIYKIPYRAIGNKIRDVILIRGNQLDELHQISLGELIDYSFDVTSGTSTNVFYVESDEIKLLNNRIGYDSVRIYYYLRPSAITKENQAGRITSIAEGVDTVTFSFASLPKKFTATNLYDFVGFQTPNKIKLYDVVPDIASNFQLGNVIFSKSQLGDRWKSISVGDYLCFAEESPVPNIPTEMHPLLAQLTAVNILEAMGDTENLANAERKLKKMEDSTTALVDDRVELAPKKIKPRHGVLAQTGLLSNGRFRQRRR